MNPTFKAFETHRDLMKAPIEQSSFYQIKLYADNYEAAYIDHMK